MYITQLWVRPVYATKQATFLVRILWAILNSLVCTLVFLVLRTVTNKHELISGPAKADWLKM